jgi:hypothetical protein
MRYPFMILALAVCVSTGVSCGPARDLAGKYQAEDPRGGVKILLLELKDDGKGSWKMDREDFAFTWEGRGNEIWLHSKSGGVISGSIQDDRSIQIAIPDVGSFRFKKMQP